MHHSNAFAALKLGSYLVLLLIVAAMGYALVTSLMYWPGIGV